MAQTQKLPPYLQGKYSHETVAGHAHRIVGSE